MIRINTDVCLGIETAIELRPMLSDALVLGRTPVILVDHNLHVGSDMGESARPVIEKALAENKVDTITGWALPPLTSEA